MRPRCGLVDTWAVWLNSPWMKILAVRHHRRQRGTDLHARPGAFRPPVDRLDAVREEHDAEPQRRRVLLHRRGRLAEHRQRLHPGQRQRNSHASQEMPPRLVPDCASMLIGLLLEWRPEPVDGLSAVTGAGVRCRWCRPRVARAMAELAAGDDLDREIEKVASWPAAAISASSGRSDARIVRPSAYPASSRQRRHDLLVLALEDLQEPARRR